MQINKSYTEAIEILGTTSMFKTFILYTGWVLNPNKAIHLANKIFNTPENSISIDTKKIAIGYLNEFFSKYIEYGKSKKDILKINSFIDTKVKTDNKIANALIELRGIRQKIKAASKTTEDQMVRTKSSFGISQGIARGTILNFKNTRQNVPKNCIGIFPTSGVKYTTQFLKCVGVIFLNGSVTSHGAILARESKIPAVVSPTTVINDYETVEINGITGVVKRVVDRGN